MPSSKTGPYKCQCEQCSKAPAPTWTRDHMAACEARFVLSLPAWRRNQFFDAIEQRRGLDGLVVLKYWMAKQVDPR